MIERSFALRLAVLGTALAGLAFVGIGAASILVRGALFSWGVGLMLILYGVLVLGIALAGWRGYGFAVGAIIAAALLHIATVGSYVTGPSWYWPALILVLPLATLVSAVWHRVRDSAVR